MSKHAMTLAKLLYAVKHIAADTEITLHASDGELGIETQIGLAAVEVDDSGDVPTIILRGDEDAGFVGSRGREAELLRTGIEMILASDVPPPLRQNLRTLLETVVGIDSLAFLRGEELRAELRGGEGVHMLLRHAAELAQRLAWDFSKFQDEGAAHFMSSEHEKWLGALPTFERFAAIQRREDRMRKAMTAAESGAPAELVRDILLGTASV
jgi:hypothetical protein